MALPGERRANDEIEVVVTGLPAEFRLEPVAASDQDRRVARAARVVGNALDTAPDTLGGYADEYGGYDEYGRRDHDEERYR